MARCWVRFPVHNVELSVEACIGSVRLVPALVYSEARKAVQKHRSGDTPFVYTANAIVDIGEHPENPADVRERAWDALWPVIKALEFLWQRDVLVSVWHVHQTPTCEDEATGTGFRATTCSIPYGEPIRLWGSEETAIRRTAGIWANDALAEQTEFQYAAAVQHAARTPFLSAEVQFVQQWLALEVLFNRWCEADDDAPKDVQIPNRIMQKEVRPAIREALASLVVSGALTEEQAAALRGAIRPNIYGAAETKAHAFLKSYGVGGFDRKWLQGCVRLRNHFLHGRQVDDLKPAGDYGDVLTEVVYRANDARRLVNRYIMHLAGYEPDAQLGPDCLEMFRCSSDSKDG